MKQRKTEWAIGFRIYSCPPGQDKVDANYIGYNHPVGKSDQYINLREVGTRMER